MIGTIENSIIEDNAELNQIKMELEKFQKIKIDIQKKIQFKIPDYIIDDIAKGTSYNHICLIINFARVNNEFTIDNANILKRKIKEMFNIKNNYDTINWKKLFV